MSNGPGINTAAVLLSSYGNVPSERAANLIGMLLGMPVSAGFVDLASERLSARLRDAGFDDAMQAALGEEPVLAADETPVNLLDPRAGLAEEDAGAPHVLVVRTPHRGLTWLRALGSRQGAAITAVLSLFAGFLISDGYSAYQQLLPQQGRRRLAPRVSPEFRGSSHLILFSFIRTNERQMDAGSQTGSHR